MRDKGEFDKQIACSYPTRPLNAHYSLSTTHPPRYTAYYRGLPTAYDPASRRATPLERLLDPEGQVDFTRMIISRVVEVKKCHD